MIRVPHRKSSLLRTSRSRWNNGGRKGQVRRFIGLDLTHKIGHGTLASAMQKKSKKLVKWHLTSLVAQRPDWFGVNWKVNPLLPAVLGVIGIYISGIKHMATLILI